MAAFKQRDELDQLFKELIPTKPLEGTEHLVSLFNQLSARRQIGMSGPQAVTFQEIQAFSALTEADLSPWEVQTLCSMDGCFLNETYKLISTQ
jgi:hypothetical protein